MRVRDAWDGSLSDFLDEVSSRRLDLRIRMLSGSQVGYARMTRRWMAPIRAEMDAQGLSDRPIYFVSSNTHSLVNLVTDTARSREDEIVAHIDDARPGLPARGAAALPRGPRRGLVGELPLLRRAALLRRQARGRRRVEAADGGRARGRRDAPLQPHGAARLRPGDGAGPARPGRPRPPPRPARRLQAQGLRGRDRQHRVPARPRRLQHPARAHRGQRRAARAPTCSARPRRSTPTSATC